MVIIKKMCSNNICTKFQQHNMKNNNEKSYSYYMPGRQPWTLNTCKIREKN